MAGEAPRLLHHYRVEVQALLIHDDTPQRTDVLSVCRENSSAETKVAIDWSSSHTIGGQRSNHLHEAKALKRDPDIVADVHGDSREQASRCQIHQTQPNTEEQRTECCPPVLDVIAGSQHR